MNFIKTKIRDQFRDLLKIGMRNKTNQKTKAGTPSQTATYHTGLYGYQVSHLPNAMKIGVSRSTGRDGIYGRLKNTEAMLS